MNETVLIYIELDGELIRLITNDFYRTEIEQFLKEAIKNNMETDDILDILEGSFPCSVIEVASFVRLTREEYKIIDLQTGEVVDTVDFRGAKEFIRNLWEEDLSSSAEHIEFMLMVINGIQTLEELNNIADTFDYEIVEVSAANFSVLTIN